MADSYTPTQNFSLAGDEGGNDNNLARGLMLVGIVLLFLFGLVALRLVCNMFIDVAILRDDRSLMRSLSELRRMVCPCWHPRTEPQQQDGGRNRTTTATRAVPAAGAAAATEMVNMESLLAGLTPAQKQDLLASILNNKVRAADLLLPIQSKGIPFTLTPLNGPSLPLMATHRWYRMRTSSRGRHTPTWWHRS
jgi:hypothetical protein